MSNSISRYLAQILSAIRGEEVRGSIHDAIAECYDDVSTSKTIAEDATAGAIAATESANEATAYANAAGDNAVASVKYFAPIFNDATAYRQNELVLYNGKLWEFVVAHPAGEWIGSDATEVAISSEVANLKQAMNSNVEALAGDIQNVNSRIEDILLRLATKFDNAYLQDGYQSFESEGVVVCGPLGPFAGGGGGGGGSGDNNAILTITNTSGWMSKTIAKDAECIVTLNWSSLENEMPTGNGSLRVTVSGTTKATTEVAQGDVQVDITNYLSAGANTVGLTITDIYGNTRTIRVSVTVIELVLMSSFDTTAPFTGPIYFPYTPRGSATKVVHFVLDGVEIGTVTTSVSDRQQNYVIPQQSHGAHNFRCYFESEINGETVRSNELYYEMICLESGSTTPIITSTYRNTTESQYSTINIDYSVYNPTAVTSIVTISVNGTSELITEVDRNSHIFSYRAENAGTLVIEISTGTVGSSSYASKSWTITVSEVSIDVEAETEGLALYLNARGRSNGEATREEWTYNDISATLTGFNWRINGWLQDEDNINVLRLSDDARVTIPYKIFQNDFKSTGKTIEIEFATRDVIDYSATIFSCVTQEENGRRVGLRITPQTVYFDGHQTSISTLYKENEHIRLSITVAKQNDYRLIQIYINGIVSRAIQYASGERFSQLNPVNISIGSDDCGIDIYNIRIYDQDLTPRQIVNNWIADTQIGTLMIDRYNRNNIFSQNGAITIETLTNNVPYMVIECPELPQFKGDEKTCTGRYVDPVDGKKSFTFEGCVINRQGTSSSIYYVANFDMKFKQGFKMTSSGNTAETYALKTGSIPFNRFVLKADVASSESANNTGLTSFYNDTCPYKTPEMVQNPKVRWGIEGVPIVLFWTNTDTGETTFQGKYNFNLPKRAPEPLGYSGNMESWEWERNNSENVKFQAADFTTMAWDEVKQEYYPAWYDDFEARFPSDEWRDTAKLGEFLRWVVSTDRTKASGNTLEPSVVYELPTIATLSRYSDDASYSYEEIKQDGVRTGYRITFTKDTPAYRLTKFRAEAPDYMEMASAEYYYLFTEMFTMIDSRAKNMFVGFNGSDTTKSGMAIDRKATFQPYDMDTAVGTNNSGVLMFGYALEDTDTVSSVISGEGGSNAPVYNAQDSVLWNNVRDAFRAEINAMYISLRTGNPKVWSYQIVENMYEQHQSKWSESVFNEDARAKYLVPLINPVTVDEETGRLVRTDRYLTMLQGSKTEQRKWWLYNRFRYMDSKFNTGDAERTINLRLFNEGTLTITPAIDMYACVRFGGGTTPLMERTTGGTPVSFAYVAPSGVTEMETWIYSADLIADVGDLSVFYPNELDFSRATRLRRLQVGSGAAGYSNTNLTTLNVQNSVLLEYIDCRNCPRLAIPVDLEGSPRLKEAYFDGTAITGVEIADGAPIETLHLPSTITALTLLNLNKLTELVIPSYSGISRVMLANMDPEIIDPVTVLNAIPANSQVNIQGLNLEMSTADDIEDFLDLLDTMVGVSRTKNDNGEWIYTEEEKAQVSGRIHTSSLTGAQIASYNARYPYITVMADHVTSYLKYYSWDGNTLLHTETILDGGDGVWNGAPERQPTEEYKFTFVGWATTLDASSASEDCTKNVLADRSVYAAYSRKIVDFSGFKYINYTTNDTAMVLRITGLNITNIVADGLQRLTIPDEIDGYTVQLG